MNTELNNYLKSIDYIPINYTSKIKDINDYIQMIFKAIEEKYNKCIFYILLNELPSNIIFVIKQCINCNYPNNDIIAFYNKDNYIFNSLSNSLSNSRINNFLEIQLNNLYKCNICFEDNLTVINNCSKCSIDVCQKCIIKSMKNIKRGNNEVKCVICQNINGNLYI